MMLFRGPVFFPSDTTHTRISTEIRHAGKIASSLARRRGRLKDKASIVSTGDPGFDDRFVLRGGPEQALRLVFASTRLRQRLHGLDGNVVAESTRLVYTEAGSGWNADLAKACLDALSDLAEAIDKNVGERGA